MREESFEVFPVIEMEMGYLCSLNGRHRPQLKFIQLWEEEIVWKTDHSIKAWASTSLLAIIINIFRWKKS